MRAAPVHATQPLRIVDVEVPEFADMAPIAHVAPIDGLVGSTGTEVLAPAGDPAIEMRRLLSIEGLTPNQFMRLLGLTSAGFSIGVAAWWMVGPQVSATVAFAVIAVAIGLALANMVALFVLVALSDSRPDSHSYMAELVAAQKTATATGRPGPVDLHPTGDLESRWGFG